MSGPEVLALMDAATRCGTARDRHDANGVRYWAAAADVFRNLLSRRHDLEAQS